MKQGIGLNELDTGRFAGLSLVVLLTLGAALLLGGCSGSVGVATTLAAVTTTAPSTTTTVATVTEADGWVRFTAGAFSIALPPNYKGGALDSQEAYDALQEVSPGDTIDDLRNTMPAKLDFHLVMFGTGGTSPYFPIVVVLGMKIAPSVSLSEATAQIRDNAKARGAKVVLGTSTANRLSFVLIVPADAGGPKMYMEMVFIKSGGYVYEAGFECPSTTWTKLKPMFQKAIGRIRVSG